jgi:hypothetical protein
MACLVPSGAPHSELISPQDADENLKERDGDRQGDPAQARDIDARRQLVEIDVAERKIEQRRGDQYFDCRKQEPAHVARARQV